MSTPSWSVIWACGGSRPRSRRPRAGCRGVGARGGRSAPCPRASRDVDAIGELFDSGALPLGRHRRRSPSASRLRQCPDRLAHPCVDFVADRESGSRRRGSPGESGFARRCRRRRESRGRGRLRPPLVAGGAPSRSGRRAARRRRSGAGFTMTRSGLGSLDLSSRPRLSRQGIADARPLRAPLRGQAPAPDEYVISADEKSQSQALGRRQPTAPPGPGFPLRSEFDYRRGGTPRPSRRLGRPLRQSLRPHRGEDRDRTLRAAGRGSDERRALRLGQVRLLGRRQRLLLRQAGFDRAVGGRVAEPAFDPPANPLPPRLTRWSSTSRSSSARRSPPTTSAPWRSSPSARAPNRMRRDKGVAGIRFIAIDFPIIM